MILLCLYYIIYLSLYFIWNLNHSYHNFPRYIYETEHFNGVAELLEILGRWVLVLFSFRFCSQRSFKGVSAFEDSVASECMLGKRLCVGVGWLQSSNVKPFILHAIGCVAVFIIAVSSMALLCRWRLNTSSSSWRSSFPCTLPKDSRCSTHR